MEQKEVRQKIQRNAVKVMDKFLIARSLEDRFAASVRLVSCPYRFDPGVWFSHENRPIHQKTGFLCQLPNLKFLQIFSIFCNFCTGFRGCGVLVGGAGNRRPSIIVVKIRHFDNWLKKTRGYFAVPFKNYCDFLSERRTATKISAAPSRKYPR